MGVVGLTRHFCLCTIPHFSLWCHFACVFLSSCILLQAYKVHTSFSLSCVRTPMHLTWLAARSHTCFRPKSSYLYLQCIVVKVLHYHPLLGLLLQTVWCLVGLLTREIPWMLAGPTLSTPSYIFTSFHKHLVGCCSFFEIDSTLVLLLQERLFHALGWLEVNFVARKRQVNLEELF